MAIKVAVVGCGYWGPNLARNFSQLAGAELAALCDRDRARLEGLGRIYPSARRFTDYRKLLAWPELQAVALATPVATHYRLGRLALEQGKDLLVEKPLAASGREAGLLISLAREQGRLLMVDHTFEYAPAINRMREIIAAGELGDLYYIRADWLNLGLLQPDVNVIWDLATHIVSILNYVTGLEPLSLKATAAAYLRREIPEVAHIQLKYAGQVRAFMTVSWLEPRKTRSITIVGKRRMLVYDLTNTEEQIKIFDKGVDLDASHPEANQWRINYRYGDIYSPNLKNVEPLSALCGHFVDCLRDRRRPRSDGESGARVVRVLEAAQRSLGRNGREIKLS